jgi:hypothetical protein
VAGGSPGRLVAVMSAGAERYEPVMRGGHDYLHFLPPRSGKGAQFRVSKPIDIGRIGAAPPGPRMPLGWPATAAREFELQMGRGAGKAGVERRCGRV